MIATPLQLATLSNAIYSSLAGFDMSWEQDGVVVGLVRAEETDVLVLRGSLTAEDWIRDAEALPVWHDKLGFVHAGFLAGMDAVFQEVATVVRPNIAVTGHSLGGARARILAAMFAVNGISVDMLCVFGSPKPAFVNLARVIQKSGMLHQSYRNRNDVVPMVPGMLPLWQHTEDWISLDAAPDVGNLEPLRDHSCALYVAALTALAGPVATSSLPT